MSETIPSPSHDDSSARLMVEVSGGSESALVELIHRHQHGLLNFFARMGAHNDAEDLVQETFVRLYKARGTYRPTAKFTTFLYVVARHVWADRGRKVLRRQRVQESLTLDAEISGGVTPPARADALDVQEALQKLSPKLREALVLNIYQGLRYQDIADVLGIPLGTVKSRINLALEDLRALFHEE